jgi:hypothetical protein
VAAQSNQTVRGLDYRRNASVDFGGNLPHNFESLEVIVFSSKLYAASVALLAFSFAQSAAQAQSIDHCRAKPVRSDAIDFPSKHAWNLFAMLVHPARPIDVARGEPDCTKPVGAPGTTAVWETWRLARTEVFLDDGAEPPEWRDLSRPRGYLGATPGTTSSVHVVSQLNVPDRDVSKAGPVKLSLSGNKPFFDPFPDNGVFELSGGIGETHMNRSAFDFIRDRCLFSKDGLQRYAKAVLDQKMPEIQFPIDSIEVKAVWLKFAKAGSDKEIDEKNKARYYVAKDPSGAEYGLSSFHVLTKDTPNWFWATFHHMDNPKTPFEVPDTAGRPKDLESTVWKNYVLGGTQTDFVTAIGEKIALADYFIEYKFPPSSCMTCHSQASGSPDDTSPPHQIIDIGPPPPDPFLKDGKRYYLPTDFVWSIPFRSRKEQQAAPARCIWK